MIPDVHATRSATVSTRQSKLKSTLSGMPRKAPTLLVNQSTSSEATPIATLPPARARTTPSVSSCRTRRPRRAPIAVRIATSRPRVAARASKMFAMFALVIASSSSASSEKVAAAMRNHGPVAGSGRAEVSGTIISDTPASVLGYCRASALAFTAITARARASDTPGLSRPSTRRLWRSRFSKNDGCVGDTSVPPSAATIETGTYAEMSSSDSVL